MNEPPPCVKIISLLKDYTELDMEKEKIDKEYSTVLKKIDSIKQNIKMELEKCFK
jgi:hypothetical protein